MSFKTTEERIAEFEEDISKAQQEQEPEKIPILQKKIENLRNDENNQSQITIYHQQLGNLPKGKQATILGKHIDNWELKRKIDRLIGALELNELEIDDPKVLDNVIFQLTSYRKQIGFVQEIIRIGDQMLAGGNIELLEQQMKIQKLKYDTERSLFETAKSRRGLESDVKGFHEDIEKRISSADAIAKKVKKENAEKFKKKLFMYGAIGTGVLFVLIFIIFMALR